MDNNILQAPLLDKEKQEQQKKSLEMLDQSVQADRVKALSGEDVYRIEKEESGVVQLRRTLGFEHVGYDAVLLGKQPATFYERDVTRYEKQKKKKGEQERDANARAKQKGLIYASDQQAALQQDVLAHLQHAKEDVLPPTYRISGTALTGEELTPDPETGAVDITGLLEKRRRLQHQSKMFKAAKKRGEKINLSTQCGLETNEQALAVLDDAVRTYYAANGIDCDTGRSVSTRKQRNAQQHLALAMENYRELAGNLQEMSANIMLDHIKEDPKYRQELEKLKNPDVKLDTTDDYASGINKMRQLIAENSEKYGSNKEIVDKLYREYLACAKRGGELYREAMATNLMLGSNRNDIQGKAADITERNALPIKLHADHIYEAMQYLLTGKEPEEEVPLASRLNPETESQNGEEQTKRIPDVGALLFLEKHCGIVTKNHEKLKEAEKEFAKLLPPTQLHSKGDLKNEALILEFDSIRLRFINAYANVKAQYDANPNDPLLAATWHRCEYISKAGGHGHSVSIMQEILADIEDNYAQRLVSSKSVKWTLSDEANSGGEKKTITIDELKDHTAPYRDMPITSMPLRQACEMDETAIMKACENYYILSKGAYITGGTASDKEINDAFNNEINVQRNAYKDMQDFIAENHLKELDYSNPLNLLNTHPDWFRLHCKSQTLTDRARALIQHKNFTTLDTKVQNEILNMFKFFGGVRDYGRGIGTNIINQQQYLQSESDAETPLPFQLTLDGESNVFYQGNEKYLSKAISKNLPGGENDEEGVLGKALLDRLKAEQQQAG